MKRIVLLFCLLPVSGILFGQRDSLDLKIGQMIMIGFPKAEADPTVLAEIKAGKAGSIIFFEKNVPNTPAAFAALKKIVWTYQKVAPVPLFVGIDQEGGKVNRLKEKYGFTRSVTAAAMGRARSLDTVRFYAEATAATLAGLGFNVNFAPDVDLAANPANPVIVKYERAFSNNEDSVYLLAKEYIAQHRKFNVLTTPKHFPGHGSSKDDTHLGLADVTNTWTDRELKPYKRLIETGYVDAIMTSHIVNLKLDPKGLPGTLSNRVLDSLLRGVLGWKGVIFSDDMAMQAITKNYGLEEAIRLGILAGLDVMCFSNNIQSSEVRTVDRVHQIIKNFVLNGQIPRERIDQSYKRIMRLKSRFMQPRDAWYQSEIRRLQSELNQPEPKSGKKKK